MDGAEIDTTDATVIDLAIEGAGDTPQQRDYEAEARAHGWTPKEDFRGDAAKWVDAETFAKRADEVMPFLKKKSAAQDREIADLKRTIKQAAAFYEKAEERAFNRAMTELQAKHDAAVETGDVKASRAVLKEMDDLKSEVVGGKAEDKPIDPEAARKELNNWIADNDWYVLDDTKRRFADLQADLMGPAINWEGGQQAWLTELGKRVEKKFTEAKPNPVNSGGNRGGAKAGGKSYADLPAAAKAQCDRFVKQGVIKDREQYARDYQWD